MSSELKQIASPCWLGKQQGVERGPSSRQFSAELGFNQFLKWCPPEFVCGCRESEFGLGNPELTCVQELLIGSWFCSSRDPILILNIRAVEQLNIFCWLITSLLKLITFKQMFNIDKKNPLDASFWVYAFSSLVGRREFFQFFLLENQCCRCLVSFAVLRARTLPPPSFFCKPKARIVRNWLDALVVAVLEAGVSILHSDCSHVVNCCPGSWAQKCLLFLFSHFGNRYRAKECLAQAQLHRKPSVANNRPSQNSPVMTKEF